MGSSLEEEVSLPLRDFNPSMRCFSILNQSFSRWIGMAGT